MTIIITKFEDLPDEAILLLKASKVDFFSSFSWYENWIKNVPLVEKEHITFLNYFQDKELKLLIPLKFNNSALESLTNYYTPIFKILPAIGSENLLIVKELLRELKSEKLRWDFMVLHAMKYEDVALLSHIKGSRLPSIPFYCFANWYLEVNQRSFDEYFASLSSRVRNTVARKTKQFNRLEGTKLEIVHKGEGLEKGIKAFETVYAASWKGEETFPDFISGLMRSASKQGALRLGIAYINNVAVAAQLWIVADNTAYIYKLAYAEKYKKLSIGSILTATLMRYVIDIDKVNYVDYLSGDDAYKKEWMSHRRERWGIMIFNWRTVTGCLKMINEYSRFYFKKILIFK